LQDEEMIRQGVTPPARFAENANADTTYSRVVGDQILYEQ